MVRKCVTTFILDVGLLAKWSIKPLSKRLWRRFLRVVSCRLRQQRKLSRILLVHSLLFKLFEFVIDALKHLSNCKEHIHRHKGHDKINESFANLDSEIVVIYILRQTQVEDIEDRDSIVV